MTPLATARRTLFALPLLAPLAPLTGALPQGSPSGSAADAVVHIDPRADRILYAMSEHLASAIAFQVHSETTKDEPHPSGQWVLVSRSSDVALHRERGLRSSMRGDLQNQEFWTDLKTAAMLDPDSGRYSVVEVPADLDAAIDHLLEEYGIAWPLADLAYSNPYVGMIEGVEVGAYIGLHPIAGTPCHHLAFQQATIDWQIWIDAGPRPLPRKVVITYKRIRGTPRLTALLSDWDFAPHLPASMFEFDPPEGAQQVELESTREN